MVCAHNALVFGFGILRVSRSFVKNVWISGGHSGTAPKAGSGRMRPALNRDKLIFLDQNSEPDRQWQRFFGQGLDKVAPVLLGADQGV